MSFVAVAIGGSAVLGVGGSLASGFIGANASRTAAASQYDAQAQAGRTLQSGQNQALGYLSPYFNNGLQAGQTLSSLFVSPTERMNQLSQQRAQLASQIDTLNSQYNTHEGQVALSSSFPLLTGKNASERRGAAWTDYINQGMNQLRSAQSQLKQLDTQIESVKNAPQQSPTDILQQSPGYQFASTLAQQSLDRKLAAQGLTNSGAALQATGLLQGNLSNQMYQGQVGNLFSLYNQGGQAAGQIGNVLTGTAGSVAGTQQAQGQAQAQGSVGVGSAEVNAIGGVGTALNSAAGAYMQNSLYDSLKNRLNTQQDAGNIPSAWR